MPVKLDYLLEFRSPDDEVIETSHFVSYTKQYLVGDLLPMQEGRIWRVKEVLPAPRHPYVAKLVCVLHDE